MSLDDWGDCTMRALFLVIILLAPLTPSMAQDQKLPSPNVSQPAQRQPGSSAAKENGQNDRMLDRMGPGIDWDHRKPGRDWKVSPGQSNGKAEHN